MSDKRRSDELRRGGFSSFITRFHNSSLRHSDFCTPLMSVPAFTPVAPEEVVRGLLASERLRRAFRFFEEQSESINEEHARICSIPAPPFGEGARAEYMRARFVECGLAAAQLDEAGNCVALRRGRAEGPLLVVSAHLDTVFPAGTDCA